MPDDRFRAVMEHTSHVNEEFGVPMKGGKSYLMVKDRIQIFRQEFGDEYGIRTLIDYPDGFGTGAPIIASAHITDRSDRIIATGWASEFVGASKMLDASPVEIAETSAIGRALACFGIQGSEYASLDEMVAHQAKSDFRSKQPSDMPHQYGHDSDRRNGQDQRKPEAFKPSQTQSIWYIPPTDETVFDEPDREVDMMIQEIERIDNTNDLGRYWSDLKRVVDVLKKEEVGRSMIAEIKAAMATRHNTLGARR